MGNPPASLPQMSVQSSSAETPMDRRRHPRYPCEGYAEVFVPQGALLFQGKILDLSISGCFIETSAINLERGTPVEVYFVTRQLQFRIAGHIAVLRRKRGAGIAFQALGARRTRMVAELIRELEESAKSDAENSEKPPLDSINLA